MTLTTASLHFLRWLGSTTLKLVRVDRRTTLMTITSIIVSQAISVLVFFLPLKIVLLLGSEGVPRYFEFFISNDTVELWVGILSALIIVLYVLTFAVESRTERWSAQGATALSGAIERVPIAEDESAATGNSFQRICDTSARLLFAGISLAAGLFLYTPLFLVVGAVILAEFVLATKGAGDLAAPPHSRFATYIRHNVGGFLGILQSVNFFTVFAFLVLAYLFTDGPNILFAIASILISRQISNGLIKFVKGAQRLSGDRDYIDALLFTKPQVDDGPPAIERQLRTRYTAAIRLDRVRRLAAGKEEPTMEPAADFLTEEDAEHLAEVRRSIWVDSGSNQSAVFDLYLGEADEAIPPAYRERVYARKTARGVTRQDYLQSHMDPELFQGVRTVVGYREGPFSGRLFDIRGLGDADRKTFKSSKDGLLVQLAGVEIPLALKKAYSRAHLPLSDRVQQTVVDRLGAVVDEPWAEDAHREFTEQLSPLLARVDQLPLMLLNPRVQLRNAMVDTDGNLRLIDWRAWKLDPVGAGFDPQRGSPDLLLALAAAVRKRSDAISDLRLSDLLCAGLLHQMHSAVVYGRPKHALRLAHDTLPLLRLPDADVVPALEGSMSEEGSDIWADEDPEGGEARDDGFTAGGFGHS